MWILKNRVSFKFNENRILLEANFWNVDHKASLMVMEGPTQNLGLIGLAVLTFIGYTRTDTQTDTRKDKQSIFFKIIKNKIQAQNIKHLF